MKTILCLMIVLCAASEAAAQKLQWTDAVYVRGRWQAGKVVAPAAKDTLALVMRVDYFSNAPRWRAEIRRTSDGINFAEPTILLGEKQNASVLTPVGATPLEQHALGKDSLVRAAVVFDATGQRVGPTSGPIVDKKPNGSLLRVAFRRATRAPAFSDDILNPANRSASRQIISKGLVSVGDQRSATVVATAGARGVDKVKTARGEVAVTPDSVAILRMERFSISAVRLEDFLRAGGLGPYKVGAP